MRGWDDIFVPNHSPSPPDDYRERLRGEVRHAPQPYARPKQDGDNPRVGDWWRLRETFAWQPASLLGCRVLVTGVDIPYIGYHILPDQGGRIRGFMLIEDFVKHHTLIRRKP